MTEAQVRKVYVHLNEPDILVYINPVPTQVETVIRKSKYHTLRGHLNHRLIIWDGSDTTHDHMNDAGDMGRMDCIRLWATAEQTLHVVLYGMDQRYPNNPETGEMFETIYAIADYVKNSPLVKTAFPNHKIVA